MPAGPRKWVAVWALGLLLGTASLAAAQTPSITVSNNPPSRNGDVVTVPVKLRNSGSAEARDLRITRVGDTLLTAPATYRGPSLPILLGTLAAGATVTQDLDFNLNGLAGGATLRFNIGGRTRRPQAAPTCIAPTAWSPSLRAWSA